MKITSVLLLTILCIGCRYSSPKNTTPQPGVVPKITELSPDNAKAGGPGFTLTVNGSSFGTNAVVNWNGTGAATTFVTSNQLAAAIPATAIATTGTVPLSVTNLGMPGSGGPYGGGGTTSQTSNTMNFTVE
jgi:IPT/TIG domain-containing protein